MNLFSLRGSLFTTLAVSISVITATLSLDARSDMPRGGPAVPPPVAQKKNESAVAGDHEFLSRASIALNSIAKNAMPAVVSITTLRTASPHPPLPNIPGFPGLEPPEAEDIPGQDLRMIGIGSGIIVRPDGLVLTNSHVVEEAERIIVTFDEKHKTKAHLVGVDSKTDLAVIQLEGPKKDYPIISYGNSDEIREGDWAIAIGSPFGLNRSVSLGIISAKGRAQMGILDVEDFIQTDAAINPGSSGGPLLNSNGELIGVNTAIFSQGGGNMGIGFAVPSKIAKDIATEIITKGHVSRGWAGLMAQDLDPDLAKFFKVPVQTGALISGVSPSGPAGRASMQNGDVVTKFNNQTVEDASTLKLLVGKTDAGTKVPVEIIRNGEHKTVTLAVQIQPGSIPPRTQQAGQAPPSLNKKKHPSFGVVVEDIPAIKNGTLVVGVNPGSPAFDAGVAPGDIILKANRTDIHNAREFKRIAKDLSDEDLAVLYIQRGPVERVFVPINMKESEG